MSNLKELRKRAGLTLTELAGQVGTSAPQISRLEKGERKLTKEWANRLAPALNCQPQDLMFGPSVGLAAPQQAPYSLSEAYPGSLPLDIPVYKAVFDASGGFRGLAGDPIDYVRRLPRLSQARNVLALYAENSSMAPRFEQGDILYANPDHPPKPGDYVMIELQEPGEHPPSADYIKRLLSRTAQMTIVEQLTPQKQFELDNASIKTIFRIIPWNELVSG